MNGNAVGQISSHRPMTVFPLIPFVGNHSFSCFVRATGLVSVLMCLVGCRTPEAVPRRLYVQEFFQCQCSNLPTFAIPVSPQEHEGRQMYNYVYFGVHILHVTADENEIIPILHEVVPNEDDEQSSLATPGRRGFVYLCVFEDSLAHGYWRLTSASDVVMRKLKTEIGDRFIPDIWKEHEYRIPQQARRILIEYRIRYADGTFGEWSRIVIDKDLASEWSSP